jgi:hypothetical protein
MKAKPTNASAAVTNSESNPISRRKKKKTDGEKSSLLHISSLNLVQSLVKPKAENSFGGMLFRDRLITSISMFLAEFIAQVGSYDDSVAIGTAEDHHMPTGSNSNSNSNSDRDSYISSPEKDEIWPDIIPDHFDMNIGPLNPQEVCVCMLRWALDGKTSTELQVKKTYKKVRESFIRSKAILKDIIASTSDMNH